jgi:3-oxoacyl-[acyl-carrier-protein] synthase II
VNKPRVVITGVGLVTGLSGDKESTWKALLAGHGAVRRLNPRELADRAGLPERLLLSSRFLGAPAMGLSRDFDENVFLQEPNVQMALRAAKEAVREARIDWDALEPYRLGSVIGTSKGGMQSFSRMAFAESSRSNKDLPREIWPMVWPDTPASLVAETWNIQGPVLCPVAACATGLMSLSRGAELIRHGTCDLVLAGSTDASLQPAVLGAFSRMGVLARNEEDPAAACKPFDLHRNGFIVGEGAAVVVMERSDLAIARGVVPYAEWLAGGCVSDPTGIAQLDREGTGLIWLIKDVLRRSETPPEEIDYINLHGTGTWDNDRTETRAVRLAFGPHADRVSCSSLKGALGHLLGAAGSVETAVTLLAMRDGMIPPTRNLQTPDPGCDLDYTPSVSRPRTIGRAMKLSLGFGGHQVAAVLGQWKG